MITFFREALEELVREQNLSPIAHLHSEIVDLPIYRLERRGEPVCIALPFATSPGAVCTLEDLHALGAEKFVVCGGWDRQHTVRRNLLETALDLVTYF